MFSIGSVVQQKSLKREGVSACAAMRRCPRSEKVGQPASTDVVRKNHQHPFDKIKDVRQEILWGSLMVSCPPSHTYTSFGDDAIRAPRAWEWRLVFLNLNMHHWAESNGNTLDCSHLRYCGPFKTILAFKLKTVGATLIDRGDTALKRLPSPFGIYRGCN